MTRTDIQMTPPLWDDSFPDDRIAHLVGGVARSFARALQSRLDSHSMPISYWKYLRVLWKEDGITQQELSVRAGLTPAMTSGAMKGMKALEYIVWAKLPSNKKNTYVYLTPKGRALKARLIPLAEEVNAIGLRGVSDKHLEIARKVLVLMFKNLEVHEDIAPASQQRARPSARAIRREAVGR